MTTVDFISGEQLYLICLHEMGHRMVRDCHFVEVHESGRLVTESRGVTFIGGTAGDCFKVAGEALRKALQTDES